MGVAAHQQPALEAQARRTISEELVLQLETNRRVGRAARHAGQDRDVVAQAFRIPQIGDAEKGGTDTHFPGAQVPRRTQRPEYLYAWLESGPQVVFPLRLVL